MRHPIELCEFPLLTRIDWRRFARIIATLLLSGSCCLHPLLMFAQAAETIQAYPAPPAQAKQAPTPKYSVTGTVVDAVTGEPVRKALVQLNGQQRRTTFSDGDGRFQFDGILPDQVSVTAQKPGYFSEQELTRGGGLPPVEVGPNAAPAVVKLTPEAVITGRVTTAAGVPLEHLSMSLNYIDVREGRRRWQFNGSAITDEDGRFRFANLRPGTYYVGAALYTPLAETMLEANQPPTAGYPGTYYPGVPDLASASPIQLTAGQQAEANFTLNEVPVYTISGVISGYAPNQGVSVQVVDQSGVPVPTGVQFSSENGRFDLHAVAAGSYVLKVTSSMGPNQSVRAELRLNLTSNVYNLHLALAPELSIPVVVQMESQPKSGREQIRYANRPDAGPPVSVRLVGTGPGTNEVYASYDGPENQRSLTLHNVEPGRYSAVIDARESWYVVSADYGQTNLLTDDLVVTPGAPAFPLNIVLRNDSAKLSGTVNVPDGMIAPLSVVAIPQGLAKASPHTVYYNPPREQNLGNSAFVLESLAPGDYLVFAFDHADGLEYSNPDVLQNYISQAAHVTLSPNQNAKVTLQMIRTEEGAN